MKDTKSISLSKGNWPVDQMKMKKQWTVWGSNAFMLSLGKQLAKFKRKNELPLEHWQQQQQQSLCACSATTASGDDSTNSWSVVEDEVLTHNMKDKTEELEKNKSWHLKKRNDSSLKDLWRQVKADVLHLGKRFQKASTNSNNNNDS